MILVSLFSMADQASSTAAKKSKKKDGGIEKLFQNLIKRPKSTNDSASSKSNSTRVSVSEFSDHDLVVSAEPKASSMYTGFSVIDDDLAPLQMSMLPCINLNSYLADLAELAHHQILPPPFSQQDLFH